MGAKTGSEITYIHCVWWGTVKVILHSFTQYKYTQLKANPNSCSTLHI